MSLSAKIAEAGGWEEVDKRIFLAVASWQHILQIAREKRKRHFNQTSATILEVEQDFFINFFFFFGHVAF